MSVTSIRPLLSILCATLKLGKEPIKPIKAILNFTPGDAELFVLLLKIYLAQSLNYDDVLREDKEWIKKVLSTGANKG